MNKLELERKKNRILYRELFFEADKTFKEQLNKLKENFSCPENCSSKGKNSSCKDFPNSFIDILPDNCSFKDWQKLCIEKIKNEIEPDLQKKAAEIINYRYEFKCKRTGTCCKLACSEYSYDELKQKAQNGDNFAEQFTSVFIPYKSLGEAREVFSDYVDLVLETLESDEKIYFYHCPNITKDNVCTIYEKRPQICRDFPDNPLSILPPVCGFYEWKEEVMVASMMLHAMTYIYKFYLEKIEEAVC